MANGGRWLFSIAGTPIVLGINNGVRAGLSHAAQAGAFNIEVFTNPTVSGRAEPRIRVPEQHRRSRRHARQRLSDRHRPAPRQRRFPRSSNSVTGAATQGPAQDHARTAATRPWSAPGSTRWSAALGRPDPERAARQRDGDRRQRQRIDLGRRQLLRSSPAPAPTSRSSSPAPARRWSPAWPAPRRSRRRRRTRPVAARQHPERRHRGRSATTWST